MKQYFEKTVQWTRLQPPWKLIGTGTMLMVVNNLLFGFFAREIGHRSIFEGTEISGDILKDWQVSILFVPIVETLVFQYLLLHLFLKLGKPILAILLSSAIFGLCHFYNVYYILGTISGGLLLAYIFYVLGYVKGNVFEALIVVISIHSLINAIAYFY